MTTSTTYPTPAQLLEMTKIAVSNFSIVKEVVLDYPPFAEGSNRPCVIYVNLTDGRYLQTWYDYTDIKKTVLQWHQMCLAIHVRALVISLEQPAQ